MSLGVCASPDHYLLSLSQVNEVIMDELIVDQPDDPSPDHQQAECCDRLGCRALRQQVQVLQRRLSASQRQHNSLRAKLRRTKRDFWAFRRVAQLQQNSLQVGHSFVVICQETEG